jgi:hypothetical protein
MDAALTEALLDWRGRCPYNQDSDYLFVLESASISVGIPSAGLWRRCCKRTERQSKRHKTCSGTQAVGSRWTFTLSPSRQTGEKRNPVSLQRFCWLPFPNVP